MTIPDPKARFGDLVLFRLEGMPEATGKIVDLVYKPLLGRGEWEYKVKAAGWANRRHMAGEQILEVLKKADA